MPKAVSVISFVDRDSNNVYNVKVTIHNDFSITHDYVGEATPVIEKRELKKESFGDKVEKFIDKVTGGQVKKCGGCARRKALLDKIAGGKDEQ